MNWILLSPPPLSSDPDNPPKFGTCTKSRILLELSFFISTFKMDYENMRVAGLKALARERGLRGYPRLRRTELIALLRSARDQGPQRSTRGTRPPRFAETLTSSGARAIGQAQAA